MVSESPHAWPAALTEYVTWRLQCEPELLIRPGVHFVVAHQPRLRVWRYAVPLWLMVFEQSAVVSSAPQLESSVRKLLRGATAANVLDDRTMASLRALASKWGPLDWFARATWLYCTRETFTARRSAEVVAVPPDHPDGRALRDSYRGEVFGVFRGGELVSRSSIKTESEAAWEVAVTTVEHCRRQGLGASVVSRATQFILDHGKPALYHCEEANQASLRLAESLGYRPFARELAWSLDAAWVPRFWGREAR